MNEEVAGPAPSQRLAELGLTLPSVAVPLAAYIPAIASAGQVLTSGQLPTVQGALVATGKVGADVTVEQATQAARVAVLNALAVQDMLEKLGYPTRVLSAITMQEVCEPFIRRRALRHMEKGRVVICAAGTGNPYFTTDTTAALRGMELKCDAIIKATKVDGIYDKDPTKFSDAVKFDSITYDETLARHLGVMDATAFALVRDNNVPIIVCRMFGGDICRAVTGESVGTIVQN